MRILVFDNQITGHHLEYLHHLMMMAAEHSGDSFIFSVPKQFKEIKDNLEWPFLDNVSYDYLEGEIKPQSNGLFEMLKTSLQLCRLTERLIRRHQIDEVYTNGIMAFVPFAPFFIPRRTRLSGIVYQIYLYVDNDSSFLSRILNRLKYTALSKCRTYKSVFILNSNKSASKLNELYHTKKFVFLPDPVIELPQSNSSLRTKYNISSDKVVFAHFGELSERKGTLNILKSLDFFNEEEIDKTVFIFAGVVKSDIKDRFYSLTKRFHNIIVEDGFCSYDYLGSLCNTADVILLPYLFTNLSSGLLGYASQFGKPVIAPSSGLIGELVEEYQLGKLLNSAMPDKIAEECKCAIKDSIEAPSKYYCETHSVGAFNSVIYNALVK